MTAKEAKEKSESRKVIDMTISNIKQAILRNCNVGQCQAIYFLPKNLLTKKVYNDVVDFLKQEGYKVGQYANNNEYIEIYWGD